MDNPVDMSVSRQYAARMGVVKTKQLPALDSEQIAQRLRMYMGDKKISRSKLAAASGINRTSLGTKLDGHVDFTLREVTAICGALGKPWWWLLTGEDSWPHEWPPSDEPVGYSFPPVMLDAA